MPSVFVLKFIFFHCTDYDFTNYLFRETTKWSKWCRWKETKGRSDFRFIFKKNLNVNLESFKEREREK